MGIAISKEHWVQLTYETDKGLLFTFAKKYQAWFPRRFIKSNIELYDAGKLKKFILPGAEWLTVGRSWDTRKTFENRRKAKKIPENQTRLFTSQSEIREKQKEITRQKRERKKRMKRMRDNIGRPEYKFKGN